MWFTKQVRSGQVAEVSAGATALRSTPAMAHAHTFALVVVASAMALVIGLTPPRAAYAGWPLASPGSARLLGFGASYADDDGTTSVHRGLDIAGTAGESVVAPLAGTVTFVGRIPGADGTTMLAITINTASGSVTLLPLDRASVTRGAEVAEGDAVATLADVGDASSSATHLHVGLREGTLYLDPATVLAPPPAVTPDPEPQVAEEGAAVAEGAAVTDPVSAAATGAQVGAGAVVGDAVAPGVSVAGASSPAGAGAQAYGTAVGELGAATSELGGAPAELSPGVSLASQATAPANGFEPTGILAETGQTLETGGRLARAASSAVNDGRLGTAISRGLRMAGRGARSAALLATGVLCALGALWPLWRAGGLEGLSKVPVSAMREDVAAVASR